MKARFCGGYDVAVILFPGGDEYSVRQAQLSQLFMQAGIIPRLV